MKKRMLLVGMCLVIGVASASSQKAGKRKECWDRADTQSDMNDCAGKDFTAADKELNRIFQAVLKKYESDSVVVKKLQKAQRAWLAFRDAEIDARYPNLNAYGSVQPMCESMLKAQLTQDRIKRLRMWLDGIEEGDVCTGAIAVREKKAADGHKH